MSLYKKDLLNHFIRVDAVASALGMRASLDVRSFRLELKWDDGHATLHPQFIVYPGGVKQFTARLDAQAATFVGWRPRPRAQWQWELSRSKLAFKAFAAANGIPTPAFTQDPRAAVPDVIVKRDRSSFAANIRGPFRNCAGIALDVSNGEYFERFVPGTICKAWFFEGRPVCMELERMPWLRGDGETPLRRLAEWRLEQRGATLDLVSLAPFLAYKGKSLGSVLAAGEAMTVEFRYNSPLLLPSDTQSVEIGARTSTPLTAQLAGIGSRLWQAIPAEMRHGTIFTVDAIVDGEGRAWALEVNSNPFLHPAMYEPMLRSIARGDSGPHTAESPLQALA